MRSSTGPRTPAKKTTGARNQQTARAGEYFVAAELNRRGAYAVTFAGNMPGIDIMASNVSRKRTVGLQVKTRRRGDWQTTWVQGRLMRKNPKETHFWAFVDLTVPGAGPDYYIVPNWWIRSDIYRTHQRWLERRGGKRPRIPESKHHKIGLERIKAWKDCWGLLKLV